MSITPVEISVLEEKAANVYEAIVIISKRARQINEEQKIEFNQRLEILHQKMKEDEGGDTELPPNPDQIIVGKEFEKAQKPTELAIQDFLVDKLEFRYKEADPDAGYTN